MNKYEDKLLEKIKKKIKESTKITIPETQTQYHQNSPINYKPWFQGEEASLNSQEIKNSSENLITSHNLDEKNYKINTKTQKSSYKNNKNPQKNTVNKLDAKWMQSGCKVDAQLDAKWMQSGCKVDAKISNNLETRCKVDAQLDAELDAKWMQSRCKVDAKNPTYASLVGTERALIFLIYNECQQARSKATGNLTIEHIQSVIKSKKPSIKSAAQRLEKKGLIKRISFKNGRGGWSKYTMSDLLFMELLNNETGCKLDANWMQTGCKVDAQLDAQLDASVVVSSYINNNKILTTKTALPEEFKDLDFYCLTNIGFDESHVIQIHREYKKKPDIALSTEIIQNSINAFAFDLKHNKVSNDFKGSPAVVLTALLKKGQPYSSKTPEKVLTPKEEALREYSQAQEIKQRKINEITNKAKEFTLQEWLNSLSTEELLNFNQEPRPEGMIEKIYQISRRKKALELAKEYFDIVLWPEKLIQILNNVEQSNKLQE